MPLLVLSCKVERNIIRAWQSLWYPAAHRIIKSYKSNANCQNPGALTMQSQKTYAKFDVPYCTAPVVLSSVLCQHLVYHSLQFNCKEQQNELLFTSRYSSEAEKAFACLHKHIPYLKLRPRYRCGEREQNNLALRISPSNSMMWWEQAFFDFPQVQT